MPLGRLTDMDQIPIDSERAARLGHQRRAYDVARVQVELFLHRPADPDPAGAMPAHRDGRGGDRRCCGGPRGHRVGGRGRGGGAEAGAELRFAPWDGASAGPTARPQDGTRGRAGELRGPPEPSASGNLDPADMMALDIRGGETPRQTVERRIRAMTGSISRGPSLGWAATPGPAASPSQGDPSRPVPAALTLGGEIGVAIESPGSGGVDAT